MEQDIKMDNNCGHCGKGKCRKMHGGGSSGAVYGLGFVGAAIYYIQLAPTFWVGVVGVLKAIVWPAFVVYHALAYLGV
ncbi:MAG: hypothetical protein WC217_02385 [Candidatus Paceibacterota bacterium]|jgi:hypothetical protein